MELHELRKEIDQIDEQFVQLFLKRMDVAARIADYKKEHGLPIFVPEREQEKLADVERIAGPAMADYVRKLYSSLFELSRNYQVATNTTGDAQ